MTVLNLNIQSKIMSNLFIAATSFAPTTLFFGLYTSYASVNQANLTGTNFGEPPTSFNYARVEVDPGATNWTKTYNSSTGATSVINANQIVFNQCQNGDWGFVQGWLLADAATAGNIICFGAFDVPQQINRQMVLTVDAGAIKITIS